MCCQVVVSATSWSLVQRSPTDCDASLYVITKPRERAGHRPRWAPEPEKIIIIIIPENGPIGRVVYDVGLWSLAYWNCGLESHWGHGCLSVVNVVCCQVEVSATSWSLVQRNPPDCSVSLCVIQKTRESGGPGPLGAVAPPQKKSGNMRICILEKILFAYRISPCHKLVTIE
jgi:hypothetical protein